MVSPTRKLRIAFCYDSKSSWKSLGFTDEQCLEFDHDEVINAISATLRSFGHQVENIGNLDSLVRRLASGGHKEMTKKWDLVFNITEGYYGIAREAQVPALLEAWGFPFTFSDAATLALCLDKGKTKIILDYHGVPTSPFAVVDNSKSRDIYTNQHDRGAAAIADSRDSKALASYPLFIKPIAEGTSKGILDCCKVHNPKELENTVNLLCKRYPGQDMIIETFLAGREFTVGIVGTGPDARVLGTMEMRWEKDTDSKNTDYASFAFKSNGKHDDSRVQANMSDPEVQAACELALKAWRVMNCRDGGRVDVRSDKMGPNAIPHIIEINPLAGLYPDESQLPMIARYSGINYQQLIQIFLESAMKRVPEPESFRDREPLSSRL